MNSRERFKYSFEHKLADRVPIDYQSKKPVNEKLKEYYKITTERELLDILGCDFYYLSVRDISQNECSLPLYKGPNLFFNEKERICPFGIRFKRSVFDDKFGADEAIEGPLEKVSSPKDIINYKWPKPEWFDVDPLLKEIESFSDKVIIGGFWSGILGDSYRMLGFENFLMYLALKPEIVKTLVDKMTEFYLELNERLFSVLKDKLDIFFFGNDFGSQKGLLFSENMWNDFFFNNYKQLCRLGHEYGYKVMAHSCGSIAELIDNFVDAGVDVLDPVQTTAANMEPKYLKEKYGEKLVFHGGIDTQKILPTGTKTDVVDHCNNIINKLGSNGGYIFASSNSLQEDTPIENIDTMYRTAREYRLRKEK